MSVAAQELREALARRSATARACLGRRLGARPPRGDITFHRPQRPDLVVYPASTETSRGSSRWRTSARVPVTPFGAGSSLEGHVIPTRGGISLDLTRHEPDPRDRARRPDRDRPGGCHADALERAAGEHGLFFPVDPGADATLGGMAATNAAGTTTIRYGKMRANVLALEAVLADGTIVRTGSRAPKTSAGYDLTCLLVGSEGTLAVITELRVRLYGIPEHVVALRISFPTVEAACRTAAALVAAGVGVTRLELLDGWTIEAINAHLGTDYPEGPCLLVEAAGTESTVEADLELVRDARRGGGRDRRSSRSATPTARARLWAARHAAAYALGRGRARPARARDRHVRPASPSSRARSRLRARRSSASGSTPPSSVTPATATSTSACRSTPTTRTSWRSSDELVERLVVDALARGGTCTGEHGIGRGKLQALELEHGDLLPLMRGIKRVFDPNGILNPGKVLHRREER